MTDPLNANPTFDPNLPVDPNTPIDKNTPTTPGDSNVSPISDDSNIQGGAGTVTPPSMPLDDSTVKPVEPPVAVPGTESSLNPLEDSGQTGTGTPVDQGVPSTSGTPSDTGTQPPIVPDTNIPPVSEVVSPPTPTASQTPTPSVGPTDESQLPVSDVTSGTNVPEPNVNPMPEPASTLPTEGNPVDTLGTQGSVTDTQGNPQADKEELKKNTNL